MNVRIARIEDKNQITRYCEKNGFHFPNTNSVYLVEDKDDNIIGIAGLEIVVKIEPFISDGPIVAKKLYENVLQILQDTKTDRVECFTTNTKMPKVRKLYEKLGFIFAEQTNRFIKHLTVG